MRLVNDGYFDSPDGLYQAGRFDLRSRLHREVRHDHHHLFLAAHSLADGPGLDQSEADDLLAELNCPR